MADAYRSNWRRRAARRRGRGDVLDAWLGTKSVSDPAMADALAAAAATMARLDEALAGHPLQRAFLHRARLDAVRRQAAVDGRLIDPWQLAAVLEGLRLRMTDAPRIVDRAETLDAARHALALHQWMVAPDFDEEGEVQQAERHLADFARAGGTPIMSAAEGMHAWLQGNGTRPPIRAALIRFWLRHRVLRVPVPLTGAAALRADTPPGRGAWTIHFLHAVAAEAADARQLLLDLERAWFAARASVAGRRRHSHATAVVDLLAAVPLVSATTLARGLGLAVKTAIGLLESLVTAGVAVEVTHRAKRRLFGLVGLAPLAAVVRPPKRPEPGRGRGQPPLIVEPSELPEAPLPPLTRIERQRFDYGELEAAIAHAEQVTRESRRALDRLLRGAARGQAAAMAPEDDAVSGPAAASARTADRPASRRRHTSGNNGGAGVGPRSSRCRTYSRRHQADIEPLDESTCRDGARLRTTHCWDDRRRR
jgi:hypothetical protein